MSALICGRITLTLEWLHVLFLFFSLYWALADVLLDWKL